MGATHGRNAKVFANGYDLSGYLKNAGVNPSADTADSTTFNDPAHTYLPGMKDATFNASGVYDGTAAAVGTVFDTALGVAGSELSYFPAGDTVGQFGYGLQAQVVSHEVTAPVSDIVSTSMEAQSSVGAERIVSQHAYASKTGGGTATSVDGAAATSAGGVGYLHLSALTGGTATIKVQDSANDSAFTDIITFTDVTGAGTYSSERQEIAGTVRRYTRCVWEITGGTASFNAGLGRNPN